MKKLLIVAAALVTLSTPVAAAVCHPTPTMERILEKKFQQEMVVVGHITEETTFRLYASSEDRSWTVVLFNVDNTACAVVAGNHLDTVNRDREITLTPEVIELFKSLLGEDA